MTVNKKLLKIWKAVCGKAVPDHATKANSGSQGTAPLILNLDTRRR
jgi:hypothetical protein